MSDGNQGPGWWFTWVGHHNTNVGMARFLALPIAFIIVFGLLMGSVFP